MMNALNIDVLKSKLPQAGLNDAGLAAKLGVSREAVSKWLSGESMPKPDKLLKIGMLLGLPFDQLIVRPLVIAEPQVCYRQKSGRSTEDEHIREAKEIGNLLKQLVGYLPSPNLTMPPVLEKPRLDYDYIERVVLSVREEMKCTPNDKIKYSNLIGLFGKFRVILVPVFWGDKKQHGNALHIYLPDSKTTWVFLNLDSNIIDFNFWMAHELGHALSPSLGREEGEDFAEAFAQALLFPKDCAMALHRKLASFKTVSARVASILAVAREKNISPFTVHRALKAYEANTPGENSVDIGTEKGTMVLVSQLKKELPTVSAQIFKTPRIEPQDYINKTATLFQTEFFSSLRRFIQSGNGDAEYIHRVMDIPIVDAKAFEEALRK